MKGKLVTLLLILYCSLANAQLDCSVIGKHLKVDSLLLTLNAELPGVSTAMYACLGAYDARKHLAKGIQRLLDSFQSPKYNFNGNAICKLAPFKFECVVLPDFAYKEFPEEKLKAYMKAYNNVMLAQLSNQLSEEEIHQILNAPKTIDGYQLREALKKLLKRERLLKLKYLEGEVLLLRIKAESLFDQLPIDAQRLKFIIIDENQRDRRMEVSMEALSTIGVKLYTRPERQFSNYLYDFRIRVDYSAIVQEPDWVSCEKIENYLFHYVHFTITKDQRLIQHQH